MRTKWSVEVASLIKQVTDCVFRVEALRVCGRLIPLWFMVFQLYPVRIKSKKL